MDIISFNEAATANGRIEKFNANPDSNSGILTQPKVIEAGETVTIKSGRQAILADTVVNGDLVIEAGGEVFIPSGSSVDFSNGIKVNGEKLVMSIPTAYHIYNGSVEATNTEITNGFSTTLYTGNGTTQDIITDVDMDTQWGDDVSEQFGGLVWLKSRSAATNNFLFDTIRGALNEINSNTDEAQASLANSLTSFNNDGFSVGSASGINVNVATYASWNFQTTHRRTGITNHGKAYTEHYNPFTGFTIIKYEGSGIDGHEIPHSLGRKLGFVALKQLTIIENWLATFGNFNQSLQLNTTIAQFSSSNYYENNENEVLISGSGTGTNASANQYIIYGWANSYLDEANKLIGNYEIGVYQGTGAAGNKVKTRGKPAWIMFKRLDAIGNWVIIDNLRSYKALYPNLSAPDLIGTEGMFVSDGYVLTDPSDNFGLNTSGGQFLYMAVYDNDSGSGKSKYPKATDTTNLTINALVPYANGIDTNGSKVSIEYKNETITGLTLTQGKNYLYSKNDGTYGVSMIAPSYGIENPLTGDFFNLKTLKWYDNINDEITPRTYLDCIVHADHNGQVTYVEELPKIEYKDVIKANEYQGKNACTAWVNFDGTTTPPTIRDSYNVSSVIRISTGTYNVYFKEGMDNVNYVSTIDFQRIGTWINTGAHCQEYSIDKFAVHTVENSAHKNAPLVSIQIFGGKTK